jgi:hypothetical protein
LLPHQLQQTVDASMELMTPYRNYQWLHNLITGDEKWVLYVKHTFKQQCLVAGQTGIATPTNDLHPKNIMLSVWQGVSGIIDWELPPAGCTITTDLYCQQLVWVAGKIQGKQDRNYFFAWRSRWVKNYWSSDRLRFYIHLILQTWLLRTTVCCVLENDLKMDLLNFFGQKSEDLYERGDPFSTRVLATSHR